MSEPRKAEGIDRVIVIAYNQLDDARRQIGAFEFFEAKRSINRAKITLSAEMDRIKKELAAPQKAERRE